MFFYNLCFVNEEAYRQPQYFQSLMMNIQLAQVMRKLRLQCEDIGV